MNFLMLGIVIFFGVHLIPSVAIVRENLVIKFSENKYKALYSIIALVGLILIIYGKATAEFLPIWEPVIWSKQVVIVTMLFSFFLFAVTDLKSNFKRFIRHPMLIGIILWSVAHLFANGDLASMLLFGAFLIYAIVAIASANSRGAKKQQEIYPLRNDILTIVAGVIAYAIFIKYLHPFLIGVSII